MANHISVLSSRLSLDYRDAICILTGLIVFIISAYVSPLYASGDQIYYRKAYELVAGLGLSEARQLYQTQIGVSEWGHFLVVWFGSLLDINKDIFMSFINAVLAAKLMEFLLKQGANVYIAAFIVLGNYYLFVMYFAAERLKIAFILWLYSMHFLQRQKSYIALSVGAMATHISIMLLMVQDLYRFLLVTFKYKKPYFIVTCLVMMFMVAFSYEYLLWKSRFYYARSDITYESYLPILALFVAAVYYAKDIVWPLVAFVPILVVGSLVGFEQTNIFAWFVFLLFAIKVNGGKNVGIIGSSVFLTYKTLIFLTSIINTGQGF